MTPQQFISKWQRANLSERSACQQHFLDLCEVLGQPKPAAADPDGAWYTFERGVHKTTGEKGWADVWMRGHFGWEYKGKRKNLTDAYQQLLLYREDLENPPLLVVCDLDRFEIHTNFTGTPKQVHRFDLAGLADADNLDVLRKLFSEPEALRPGLTSESITNQAAQQFALLADGMRVRGVEAPAAAHFLMKLMFCMFGEDIGLLPDKIFSRILTGSKDDPERLCERLAALFKAMAWGGDFGADKILWFNGGLFADADVVDLRTGEIEALIGVNDYDWGHVEPSIFGTLFERTLDPAKRSQIGAHYTSRQDIETLLEPVVMTPLRREWQEVRAKCDKQWEKVKKAAAKTSPAARKPSKASRAFERRLLDFVERLAHVKILDPACGSGNFLYVAIHLLLDLEKEVIAYGAGHGVGMLPHVRPTQLAGIEINPYAQQLAQVVIWIGYLQWMHHNGFNPPRNPVLEPIDTIHLMDAILDLTDPENPKEPQWPKADFIVGNPPFWGGKRLRTELGDDYVNSMFAVFSDRVPRECDLVAYWFQKACAAIHERRAKRAGLIATQAIRAGANRRVLEEIKADGEIFMAWSDRPWILDGADVRVSLIAFDGGIETTRTLDGCPVPVIHSNLSGAADVTRAAVLAANRHRCFMGVTKGGAFDIKDQMAIEMAGQPANANGRPNSDVIRPWLNASDIVRTRRNNWLIDFGVQRSVDESAFYEKPFEHVVRYVKPQREKNNREAYRTRWWLHVEARPALRLALSNLARFLVTPRVAKHRVFVWCNPEIIPDSRLYAFALDSDVDLGLLSSRVHEVWALATSSRHGVGNDPTYNNTTCFETFAFPNATHAQREAISAAAKELDDLRTNWLNPPEWTGEEVLEFPGSVDGPWARYVVDPDGRGIGTVRYPRVVPRDEECAKELKRRTLTNLYNERPTWLDLAHQKLDAAVFAAYGWDPATSDEELLAKLLELNLKRAGEQEA